MSPDSLAIAQVSPHPWGSRHEINEFVARTSEELTRRGHRVLIVAPSGSQTAIRESRRLIREALRRTDFCKAAASRLLGINIQRLNRRIDRLNISVD